MTQESLLSVEGLKTYFFTKSGLVKAVDNVTFSLHAGETLALAGESGCGKSITCLSIVRLVPMPAGRIVGGKIVFQGEDILKKDEKDFREIRGKKISMILQDPLTSLNPVYTIGNQVAESFLLERGRSKRVDIKKKVIEVLERVRIPSAEKRLKDYPFQFSGGMRQRVLAAMAIARLPRVLIADEPTTSLDVTIQDQFLCLLKEMQKKNNMGILLVTHDLGIVAETCDRVAMMYAGKIIESGSVKRVFENPAHPYTEALLHALPKLGTKRKRLFQIDGEPPRMLHLPHGCSFWPRCQKRIEICRKEYPPAFMLEDGGYAACWLVGRKTV